MKQITPKSAYTQDALKLFGMLVRQHRILKKMTTSQLAERVGVSRGLVQRLERGEAGTSIGVAFEAATIVGVPLFDLSPTTMAKEVARTSETLRLMPRSVHQTTAEIDDDF